MKRRIRPKTTIHVTFLIVSITVAGEALRSLVSQAQLDLPGMHTVFTDHWIRVVKLNEPTPR